MEDVFKTTERDNRHNEHGEEILNPTVMQPPIGYKPQPSIFSQMQAQIRAMTDLAVRMEPETEEEADDFDIPDDPIDQQSRWENEMVPSIKEARARIRNLEEQERLWATAPQQPPPEAPTE